MPTPPSQSAADPAPVPWRRGAGLPTGDDPELQREWLLTDGRSGFACGSAADVAMRRYHGWLLAPVADLPGRHLFLQRCDEALTLADGSLWRLGAAWWRDLPQPSGPACPRSFARQPFPRWEWEPGGGRLERALLPAPGCSGILVRYRWQGPAGVVLRLRPLLPCRNADALTVHNDTADLAVRRSGDALGWQPYAALPVLWLTASAAVDWRDGPVWYRGARYPVDEARGYQAVEDVPSPGEVVVALAPGEAVVLAFAVDAPVTEPAAAWAQAEATAEAAAAGAAAATGDPRWARLYQGADDFLYRTPEGRLGVLAGFPWFGEWGRDVFLALPGLTLARGQVARCGEVLRGALPFLRDGVLPNIYGRTPADSHYDSADAALWFARAVHLFDRAGGERDLVVGELRAALAAIVAAYQAGAPLGLRADASGLLDAGSADRNATWMDASVGGVPVTPRDGQPVELNALWCALLAHLGELHRRAGDTAAAARCHKLHAKAARAFRERFWLPAGDYLADRWKAGGADPAVRPNMVLAAAMELAPLDREQREGVVAKARAELLTPRGLRTLSPLDPAYRGRYQGGPAERDHAYHQGTVWPWLLGSYVEAALRAARPRELPGVRAELKALLQELIGEVDVAGLDHVSEVYDGDPPHRPGGTFAQAWNTGELLRARALLEATP